MENFIHKILLIQRKIAENMEERFSLERLSELTVLNPSYLSSKFKEITGVNLESFIQRIKICFSLCQVIFRDKPIKWIARDAGYKSTPTFIRTFKSFFGITPNKIRKKFWQHPK